MVHLSIKLRVGIVPCINDNFKNVQWKYIHQKYKKTAAMQHQEVISSNYFQRKTEISWTLLDAQS